MGSGVASTSRVGGAVGSGVFPLHGRRLEDGRIRSPTRCSEPIRLQGLPPGLSETGRPQTATNEGSAAAPTQRGQPRGAYGDPFDRRLPTLMPFPVCPASCHEGAPCSTAGPGGVSVAWGGGVRSLTGGTIGCIHTTPAIECQCLNSSIFGWIQR